MTDVTRSVKRKSIATRYSRGRQKRVIVSLEPPGLLIGFRLEREKTTYKLSIGDLYCLAVRTHQQAERERRKAERKAKNR